MTVGDSQKKNRNPHWPSYARALKREVGQIVGFKDNDFAPLIEKARKIEETYYKAQALAWIARRMVGKDTHGSWLFEEAIEAAEKVGQEWRRSEILITVASEMSKAGAVDFKPIITAIERISNAGHRERTFKAVQRRTMKLGVDIRKSAKKISVDDVTEPKHGEKKMFQVEESMDDDLKSTITIGLFNTYMGKTFQTPHMRAIARASTLCYAYGFNLCLFSFPVENQKDVITKVEGATRVGEGIGYIRRLFESGRLLFLNEPKTHRLHTVGELVAATSRPQPEKQVEISKLIGGGMSFCVIMGLGSHGLPKRMLKLTKHHLELTGKNIPLETCTAMGVLVAKLDSLQG